MKFFTALALLLPVALPCSARSGNGMWTTVNSWYRPAPANLDFGDDEVPHHDVRPITKATWPQAQTLLKSKIGVSLSVQQARYFVGKDFKFSKGKTPFLVRAVYLNADTGNFAVYRRGDAIEVFHGCLGASPVPMKRWALVVFLNNSPKAAYADCGMAR